MGTLFPTVPGSSLFWGIFQSILTVWNATWWIVVPAIVLIILWEAWHLHLHYHFVHDISWKLLEIKVPKTVLKTPKAMEQIFAAAHAPYTYGIPWLKKNWEGQEEFWMIFELIGRAGETHFYLRLPAQFRNMMESAIYAQFPEAEINEVPDYLEELPKTLPNEQYDISGFEEILRHEDFLPIRTYLNFEDPTEERRIDTIAPLMEAMSKLKDGEQLWFQLLIRPTGEDFRKAGETEINKLLHIEPEKKPSARPTFDLGISLGDAVAAPFRHPGEAKPKKDEKKEKQPRFIQSPVEKEKAEAIHLKISKIAFESTLRFMYLERTDSQSEGGHTNSIHGFIRQFNTQNLNSLRPDGSTSTASYSVKGPLFKKTRIRARKRLIFEKYTKFSVGSGAKKTILNIEELATVFHFPLAVVSTSELEKVESRRGAPPASLPVIEESVDNR